MASISEARRLTAALNHSSLCHSKKSFRGLSICNISKPLNVNVGHIYLLPQFKIFSKADSLPQLEIFSKSRAG